MNCLYFPTFCYFSFPFVLCLSWMSAALTQLFSLSFNHISFWSVLALVHFGPHTSRKTTGLDLLQKAIILTPIILTLCLIWERKHFIFYKFPLSKQLADTSPEAYFPSCLLDLSSISRSLSAFCYLQDQKFGFSFSSCLCSELAATVSRCSGRKELCFVIACSSLSYRWFLD